MNKQFLLILSFLFSSFVAFSQENDSSMVSMLDDEPVTDYVRNSFKTNRVINGHSLENTAKGVFDFKISHRFGLLNEGLYGVFGLDQASMRIGGDYGVSDRLQVGLGRNTYQKTYDGYVKYKILWQSTGAKKMPISLCWISGMSINTLKWQNPDRKNYFTSRLSYFHQAIIGRRFNESFSLQLMPTMVHRNLVETRAEKNSVYLMGIGLRQKITKRFAVTAEYFYALPNQLASEYRNSLSLGFDIETGGHVFQLQFTNSTAMMEKGFLTETNGNWLKGGIHFGFNISRVFTVVRPKEGSAGTIGW
ncbi:MAG: DUF5777 family beta-barrel protein [Bacteroidia bacterium]